MSRSFVASAQLGTHTSAPGTLRERVSNIDSELPLLRASSSRLPCSHHYSLIKGTSVLVLGYLSHLALRFVGFQRVSYPAQLKLFERELPVLIPTSHSYVHPMGLFLRSPGCLLPVPHLLLPPSCGFAVCRFAACSNPLHIGHISISRSVEQ